MLVVLLDTHESIRPNWERCEHIEQKDVRNSILSYRFGKQEATEKKGRKKVAKEREKKPSKSSNAQPPKKRTQTHTHCYIHLGQIVRVFGTLFSILDCSSFKYSKNNEINYTKSMFNQRIVCHYDDGATNTHVSRSRSLERQLSHRIFHLFLGRSLARHNMSGSLKWSSPFNGCKLFIFAERSFQSLRIWFGSSPTPMHERVRIESFAQSQHAFQIVLNRAFVFVFLLVISKWLIYRRLSLEFSVRFNFASIRNDPLTHSTLHKSLWQKTKIAKSRRSTHVDDMMNPTFVTHQQIHHWYALFFNGSFGVIRNLKFNWNRW